MRTLDRSSLAPIVRNSHHRLRAGRVMQSLGVAGLITAVIGTIVGWQLVGQVDTTVQRSLELTSDTLVTLEDTIIVASDVVDSVDASLNATERTLNTVQASFGEAELVVEEVDSVLATVAVNVDTATATVEDLATIGRTIDSVLGQLNAIPFGPDYDPTAPLGAQLQELADDLAPISTALEGTGDQLQEFVLSTQALESDLGALSSSVSQINTDLAASRVLLDDYLETARDARSLADTTRGELRQDVANTRLLVILGGILVALGQIVPFWIGTELTVAARETIDLLPDHQSGKT